MEVIGPPRAEFSRGRLLACDLFRKGEEHTRWQGRLLIMWGRNAELKGKASVQPHITQSRPGGAAAEIQVK